jgi:hypothetical protein
MARAAVDCFSYIRGWGLSIIIERVLPPNGIQHSILIQRPELEKLVTAFEINPENKGNNFDTMYRITLSDPDIMLAVNDLIASIAVSHHAPINCGRVIETIREAMTPIGVDKKRGWEIMRQNLNLDIGYLKFITDVSKAPRHGKRMGSTTKKEFDEAINRSWTVMNRFFEHKKRGDKALSLAEFPLLT